MKRVIKTLLVFYRICIIITMSPFTPEIKVLFNSSRLHKYSPSSLASDIPLSERVSGMTIYHYPCVLYLATEGRVSISYFKFTPILN